MMYIYIVLKGEIHGVMAVCMEDGTFHRFRCHKTIIATGVFNIYNLYYMWIYICIERCIYIFIIYIYTDSIYIRDYYFL